MELYKAVKPKRVSDQIFEQIRDLIFRGQLRAGEKLPPERDLAQIMGVSRPTVREAINKLVARGLVTHHQGQGTFVKDPASNRDSNPLTRVIDGYEPSLVELLEVRLGLECNSAELAARRATDEDVVLLEKSMAAMRSQIAEGREGFEDDVHFHMCIAYATRNPVQIHMMKSFYDLLFYGVKENLIHLYQEEPNKALLMSQHTRILDAIRDHDAAAAFRAMHRHISFVIDFFSKPRG